MVSVDRKRATGRDLVNRSNAHHERAGSPHLLFELTDGIVKRSPSEGVRANELGHLVRVLCGCARAWLLLDQPDPHPALGELPRALGAR